MLELDATQGEFGMWGRGKGQQTPCPESPCQPARQKWGLWGNRWHPNHTLLGPCLLCLVVLERFSCPLLHPREPISVLTCRGARGKYTTNTVHCIDYKIQMHNRFTTTYEYATNTVRYTHTRRGARGKGADCSWGEV